MTATPTSAGTPIWARWSPIRSAAARGAAALGLRLTDLTLLAVQDGAVEAARPLAGVTETDARAWTFATLAAFGLDAGQLDAPLPYDLEDPLPGAGYATGGLAPALAALSAWYGLADQVLQAAVGEMTDARPGPSPVRCWPHHFDLGTLVALETGDPETARSVGIGLSPGDGSYAQPYLYVTPWPAPADLPPLGPIGRWHTEGFVSAVLTGEDIAAQADPAGALAAFVDHAYALSRQALGV